MKTTHRRPLERVRRWSAWGAMALLFGCGSTPKSSGPAVPSGEDTALPPVDEVAEECLVDGPARSPMRRLTPAELDRTLTDLLGTTGDPAARILPPEQIGGFGNNVDVRSVGADTVDAYNRLALEVASGAGGNRCIIKSAQLLLKELLPHEVEERGVQYTDLHSIIMSVKRFQRVPGRPALRTDMNRITLSLAFLSAS